MIQELKALKSLNEALEEENKKSREIIADLHGKLSLLQKGKPLDLVHESCQTEDSDLLFCEECEYPAEHCMNWESMCGNFIQG